MFHSVTFVIRVSNSVRLCRFQKVNCLVPCNCEDKSSVLSFDQLLFELNTAKLKCSFPLLFIFCTAPFRLR